jgi:hypothetical protein
MTQPKPATATTDIPEVEVTDRGRPNFHLFSKKSTSADNVAATAKSAKDKVKTGLAVVGAAALAIVAVGVVAKKKTDIDTVAVTLPAIDTVSSDASNV